MSPAKENSVNALKVKAPASLLHEGCSVWHACPPQGLPERAEKEGEGGLQETGPRGAAHAEQLTLFD